MARRGFNVAATYFPTPVQSSIIGPPSLNCRVRDGNGCDTWGKATTKALEGLRRDFGEAHVALEGIESYAIH
jgi:hypothetical protein